MLVLHLTPKDDLQKILDSIDEPATIYLKAGVYRQKIEIAKNDVSLIGEGRETTVISYGDYARKMHADGREYNTFRTYTLCITGTNVTLKNLCVENSNTDPTEKGQCVALSVNAGNFYAQNVDLKSTQDTLFTAPFPDDLVIRYSGLTDDKTYYDGFIPKRQLYFEGEALQLYENCRIFGTVDYVFGCAQAYFKDCEFISVFDKRGYGFVAAPAHSLKQEKGYVFLNCRFTDGGAGKSSVYLARPWRDFGKCVFINCELKNHIKSELFDKWDLTYRDKTARFLHYGLKCEGFDPAPVSWARELSEEKANEIIDECINKFTANKK